MQTELYYILGFIVLFFAVIGIIIKDGRILDKFEERNKPIKRESARKTFNQTQDIDNNIMAVIVSAVTEVTQGKGTVTSVTKL